MTTLLEAAIKAAGIINIKNSIGSYQFKKLCFGEQGNFLCNNLINLIVCQLSEAIRKSGAEYDYIVSPEPGGHIWGILLAYALSKDIIFLRNKHYGKEDASIQVLNGYSQKNLYLPSHVSGKVIIIDDIISTGKTISEIVSRLRKSDVEIMGIFIICAISSSFKLLSDEINVQVNVLYETE